MRVRATRWDLKAHALVVMHDFDNSLDSSSRTDFASAGERLAMDISNGFHPNRPISTGAGSSDTRGTHPIDRDPKRTAITPSEPWLLR